MSAFLIDNSLVFIHIPKTGGASIRKGLLSGVPQSKAERGRMPREWKEHKKIAVVRHPLDRFISAYHMLTEGYVSENNTGRYAICKGLTIEGFSERVMNCKDPGRGVHGDEVIAEHTIPQTKPYNLLQHADLVFRYEQLNLVVDYLNSFFGLDGELPRWNRTLRKNWREYPIPSYIIDYYKEDFKQLNYLPDNTILSCDEWN